MIPYHEIHFCARFILITKLIALSVINYGFTQDMFTKFISTEHRFEVLLPSAPIIQEKMVQSSIGSLINVSFHVSSEENTPNIYYAVQLIYYPEGSFTPDSVDMILEFLTEAVFSIANTTRTEVVYKNILTEGKYPSMLYRLADNEKGIGFKGKLILAGSVFYSLQVMFEKTKSLNKEMDIFLDSFKTW